MQNSVGYTMRDIRYKWNEGPNSVGVSSEVSLPQFKVLGHRQRAMEISLTTGICRTDNRHRIKKLFITLISVLIIHYPCVCLFRIPKQKEQKSKEFKTCDDKILYVFAAFLLPTSFSLWFWNLSPNNPAPSQITSITSLPPQNKNCFTK